MNASRPPAPPKSPPPHPGPAQAPVAAQRPQAPARPQPTGAPARPQKPDLAFLAEIEVLAAQLDELDYFQLFRLPSTASAHELKEAYYRFARDLHPDRFASYQDPHFKRCVGQIFKRVTEAWYTLRDDKKRARYTTDILGPDRKKKLRYDEASEAAHKSDDQIGTTPKGRELYRAAQREAEAGRVPGAIRQLKMALVYEPKNALFARKLKELESMSGG